MPPAIERLPHRPLAQCMNAALKPLSSIKTPVRTRRQTSQRTFASTSTSSQSLRKSYILSSARTPTGAFNSAFKSVPAPQLATFAIKSALAKSTLDPARITAAYIGNVLSADVGQSPARQASLLSGLPESTDVTTINKVCASGMKAVSLGAQAIAIGDYDVVLTGGMESMSRVPYYVPRGNSWPPFGAVSMDDGLIKDGLQDVYDQIHMGVCAERTAKKYDISREEQDAYAIRSFKRAQAAWGESKFAEEIAPVTVKGKKGETVVEEDEGYTNLREDKVPTLKPAFVHDGSGTVTAANSSTFNDGASAVILGTAEVAKEVLQMGKKPIVAEILASADAAVAPILFPIAPSVAIPIALKRAGLAIEDVKVIEINEAFAVVVRANEKILGLEEGKVNLRGGAISLGHALGSSGSRILVTLLHQLRVGEVGIAGICNGGGGGSAIVVRRVDAI